MSHFYIFAHSGHSARYVFPQISSGKNLLIHQSWACLYYAVFSFPHPLTTVPTHISYGSLSQFLWFLEDPVLAGLRVSPTKLWALE